MIKCKKNFLFIKRVKIIIITVIIKMTKYNNIKNNNNIKNMSINIIIIFQKINCKKIKIKSLRNNSRNK